MVVPLALGAHPLSHWVSLLVNVHMSLEAHGGYEFPIAFDKLLLVDVGLGGAIHHDLHHQWPSTNFQPFFTYMDRWCGTDYESSRFSNKKHQDCDTSKQRDSTTQWHLSMRSILQYLALIALAVAGLTSNVHFSATTVGAAN